MANEVLKSVRTLSDESQALYAALQDEREIACVLLSASFLDHCLATLLSRHFIESSVSNKLLDPRGGVLGTYAARSDLCYALGLVAKPVYQNLIVIGMIRNRFAHSHWTVAFADEDIERWCLELNFPAFIEESQELAEDEDGPSVFSDARERFSLVVALTANRLILTALERPRSEAKEDWWS